MHGQGLCLPQPHLQNYSWSDTHCDSLAKKKISLKKKPKQDKQKHLNRAEQPIPETQISSWALWTFKDTKLLYTRSSRRLLLYYRLHDDPKQECISNEVHLSPRATRFLFLAESLMGLLLKRKRELLFPSPNLHTQKQQRAVSPHDFEMKTPVSSQKDENLPV